MISTRQEKVAEEVRREFSQILHFEVRDPRLEGVGLTGVKMTADLRVARIYFTVPGDAETSEGKKRIQEALVAFKKSTPFFRRLIAQRISFKFVPTFEFFYDESLELQNRIDELFLKVGIG